MKKITFFLIAIIILALPIYSQSIKKISPENSSRRIYEKAILAFEQGKYGESFGLNNIARSTRKDESQWASYVLDQALKPTIVQKAGDQITDILSLLIERESIDAIDVIDDALSVHNIEYFQNSMIELRKYVETLSFFPETDYLAGKIYLIEGEYDLAVQFFLSAWEQRQYLDIPEVRFDILYSLASLQYQRNNSDGYEKSLLQIINDANSSDIEYTNNLNKAMIQSLNSDIGIDKFFLLYRLDNYTTINANILLSKYYFDKNEYEQAYIMSIHAVLTSFTRIYQIISQRDQDFKYLNFVDFLIKLQKYTDIIQWCSENKIWEGFLIFAKMNNYYGNTTIANEIIRDLAKYCPDEYWKTVFLSSIF